MDAGRIAEKLGRLADLMYPGQRLGSAHVMD